MVIVWHESLQVWFRSDWGDVHTGNPVFEEAASRALQRLWEMRTPLGLLGSSLDMVAGQWRDANGGVGASADSFYEYLLKAYILYGATSAMPASL